VREFHQRRTQIGLRAVEQYGFVLAGGYAQSANGIGERPSMDVDLFTDNVDQELFSQAVDAVISTFQDNGPTVNWR